MVYLLTFLLVSFVFCCFFYRNSFFYLLVIFEGISLFMFMYLSFYLGTFNFSFDSVMLFLSFMVIEGGFGLSLLIFIVSRMGDDKMSGSSLLYF